jgi:hypothetical protein
MTANNFKILIATCCCFVFSDVKSQIIKPDKPNIYFYIDTSKIPLNDRLYKITKTNKYIAYEILCPCFYDKQHPGFMSNLKPTIVSKTQIEKYNFITLKDFLLKLCKEQESFGRNNNIYFVEKVNTKYYKYLVLMESIFREE